MREHAITGAALAALVACDGGDEAIRVELPVATTGAALAATTTDLGYTVTIDRMRIAVADLEFTVAGETHQTAAKRPRPHPGHSAGGEVTGELPGDVVLTWDGAGHPVGVATLLVGDYHGANFGFRAADAGDGLDADDPLLGHTFHLTGTAVRGEASVAFDAALDVAAGTALVGAVFDHAVTAASTEMLSLVFFPTDPVLGKSAFDGVEFAGLAVTEGVARIRPGAADHNVLRRAIQIHDHYAVQAPRAPGLLEVSP
jgi:hypothetical protein